MKQTCYGCRALNLDWCNLGYKNSKVYNPRKRLYEIMPLEYCPKPLTYDKWLRLTEEKNEETTS